MLKMQETTKPDFMWMCDIFTIEIATEKKKLKTNRGRSANVHDNDDGNNGNNDDDDEDRTRITWHPYCYWIVWVEAVCGQTVFNIDIETLTIITIFFRTAYLLYYCLFIAFDHFTT